MARCPLFKTKVRGETIPASAANVGGSFSAGSQVGVGLRDNAAGAAGQGGRRATGALGGAREEGPGGDGGEETARGHGEKRGGARDDVAGDAHDGMVSPQWV